MPISTIEQPEYLSVSADLRLRRYDGFHDFAFAWYQDPELVRLVDGVARPYDRDTLDRMYSYLDKRGELYFIEALTTNGWKPIGDVAFWQEDLPIVIGDGDYRGRGIGRAVLTALIQRACSLGWSSLQVQEIYHFNISSQKLFTGVGFIAAGETDKGKKYILNL